MLNLKSAAAIATVDRRPKHHKQNNIKDAALHKVINHIKYRFSIGLRAICCLPLSSYSFQRPGTHESQIKDQKVKFSSNTDIEPCKKDSMFTKLFKSNKKELCIDTEDTKSFKDDTFQKVSRLTKEKNTKNDKLTDDKNNKDESLEDVSLTSLTSSGNARTRSRKFSVLKYRRKITSMQTNPIDDILEQIELKRNKKSSKVILMAQNMSKSTKFPFVKMKKTWREMADDFDNDLNNDEFIVNYSRTRCNNQCFHEPMVVSLAGDGPQNILDIKRSANTFKRLFKPKSMGSDPSIIKKRGFGKMLQKFQV